MPDKIKLAKTNEHEQAVKDAANDLCNRMGSNNFNAFDDPVDVCSLYGIDEDELLDFFI